MSRSVFLGFAVLVAVLVTWFVQTHSFVSLNIKVNQTSEFRLYWAEVGQAYGESRSAAIKVYPRKRNYLMWIPDLQGITRLRIDPTNRYATTVSIRNLTLYGSGHDGISLFAGDYPDSVELKRDLEEIRSETHSITVKSTSGDPQMEWFLEPQEVDSNIDDTLFWLVSVLFLVLMLRRLAPVLSRDYQFVVYGMLIILVSAVVMSHMSQRNVHPDEYVHIKAAQFYADHWLPVAACEVDSQFTYSVYGASRLNSNEIYYYFAGRILHWLTPLPAPDYLKLRYVNLALLVMLLIAAIRLVNFRLFALPLLFSPQLWYAFSYVNSEAMAITVAMFSLYWVFGSEHFRRLIRGEAVMPGVLVITGLLAGLMLLQKTTFYFVLAFIGLTAAFWVLIMRRWNVFPLARRLLLPVALAFVTWLGVEMLHQYTNDFERQEQVADCVRTLAKKAYHPDTPLEHTVDSLYWRDKGRPFSAVLDAHWGTRVFSSAFGYYGYLYVPGSTLFYVLVKVIGGGLILFLLWTAFRKGSHLSRAAMLSMFTCFIGLVAITLWNSWTKDFQPQGRYFFSIALMLGAILFTLKDAMNRNLLLVFTGLLGALSLFSFLFMGVTEVIT